MTEHDRQETASTGENDKSADSSSKNGHIILECLPNTRDLGGIKARDGRRIKAKALLRSGTLKRANEHDVEVLVDDYHVSKVIDLRTEKERELSPDPIEAFKGVRFVDVPILGSTALGITREMDKENLAKMKELLSENPLDVMTDIYKKMIRDNACQAGFARFFDEVLDEDKGAVLWHCSVGKDRVGLCTAFLLFSFGVDNEVVTEDYLATNFFTQNHTQEILSALAAYNLPSELRSAMQVLNSADERFLQAAFGVIDSEFGGMDAYLRDKLKVTEDKKRALQDKYLV